MGKPTNVLDRYNINNGVREDLTDIISNVDPDETPVFSSAGRTKAKQTYHEYQRDTLRAPNGDNAAVDGDDASLPSRSDTQRLGNYTQIFRDSYGVTGRAEAVDKAGRKSEKARIKAKATKEVKRDIEARWLSESVAAPGSDGVASKTAGIGLHIYTNASYGGSGATPSHTSGAPTVAVTAGTNRAFTETLLLDQAQNCFNSSGKAPPMVIMSAAHKRKASSFAGLSAQRTETGRKKMTIISAADAILTDFGLMMLTPHYIMSGLTYVLGLDPEYIKNAYLRGWETQQLARTGDAEREQILVDVGVEVTAEKVMFKIANLHPNGTSA